MRCTILASGSKGNAALVEGQGGTLLIDAGLSAKETLLRIAAAGGRAGAIGALLVTHEHGDHIRGVGALSRRLQVPVCATAGTLNALLGQRCTAPAPIEAVPCRYGETVSIAGFSVTPFATSHDAAEPCGFTVREDGVSLGLCTDTGIVTERMLEILRRCDGIVLESNHCPVMLREGPYPESLKRRIRSAKGHLSNSAAAECLRHLGQDVHQVALAHLSEVNNTPGRALAGARDGLGLLFEERGVIVASQGGTSARSRQVLSL